MQFIVKGKNSSDYVVSGENLKKAIEENFPLIARKEEIGNAAGYNLAGHLFCEYHKGILGGKGGAELIIKWRGADLAHKPASKEVQTSTIWIHATPKDIPEPFVV